MARLSNLAAHARPEPEPLTADLPAGVGGLDLIAGENQARWFANIDQTPPHDAGSAEASSPVRIFNPETGVVFGHLPLDDFLMRMVVQELVVSMRPALWDRHRVTGAVIPDAARATEATDMISRVDGLFPRDVAVGDDWILTYNGPASQTVHLLRYRQPAPHDAERLHHALTVLGASETSL